MASNTKLIEQNDSLFVDSTRSSFMSVPQIKEDSLKEAILNDSSSVNLYSTDSFSQAKHQTIANQSLESFVGKKLPNTLHQSDGMFFLLLVCFLLFTHMYQGGIGYLKENFALIFSTSKTEKLAESQKTLGEFFYSYFLVFLAILLFSISVYEGLERISPSSIANEQMRKPFITIGVFVILISIFVIIKLVFNRFLGYVFDLGKKCATWNQSYIFLLGVSGALCFLPTLLLVYSEIWHMIIIVFSLVLFLLVQLLLIVRILAFFFQQKYNIIFLLAYFCSVEILPYIFLGLGLVYIHQNDILIHY